MTKQSFVNKGLPRQLECFERFLAMTRWLRKSMFIIIFVTAKDLEEANKISTKLVESKLAACVNIVDGVKSIFRWQGKVNQEEEVLLIIKTKKNLFSQVTQAVKSLHSYDVPEIIALPIIDGSEDYLKWLDDSCKN